MPSKSILEQKQQIVSELAEEMRNSVSGVLVNYQGITVEDDTKMRKALREAGVRYMVVKNSLGALAAFFFASLQALHLCGSFWKPFSA